MQHKKFIQTERELLSQWIKEGLSNYECARRLSRHVSTIGRELKWNKTRVAVGKDWEIIYEPLHAQHVAQERKQHAFNSKFPLKNKNIYSYVIVFLCYCTSADELVSRTNSGKIKENRS